MVVTYCWFCPFVYWVLAELFSALVGKAFTRANSLKMPELCEGRMLIRTMS